jgi:anti-sigma regulatory factor (Ser/Thr protein kinase)
MASSPHLLRPVEPVRAPLSRHPRSASTARRVLADALEGTRCESTVDVAELLVSELVGNAVRYGREPVELDIRCVDGLLEVGVRDGDRHHPQVRSGCEDELAEGGRGLCLVEELAERWGSEDAGGGKRVWFLLAPDPVGPDPVD